MLTLRMKNRRMCWSVNGANHLAKVLYWKENRERVSTIERYTDGLIFSMELQEAVVKLSAAKASRKDGKENSYVEKANNRVLLFRSDTDSIKEGISSCVLLIKKGNDNDSAIRRIIIRKLNKLTDIIKERKSANDYLTHTVRTKDIVYLKMLCYTITKIYSGGTRVD